MEWNDLKWKNHLCLPFKFQNRSMKETIQVLMVIIVKSDNNTLKSQIPVVLDEVKLRRSSRLRQAPERLDL